MAKHRQNRRKSSKRRNARPASDSFGGGILPDSNGSEAGPKIPYPRGLPTDQPLDVDDYFDQLHVWLDLESEAERVRLAQLRQIRSQKDVESTGQAIVGLELIDSSAGLAGRYLLDLCKPGDRELPMNRLKVGSPVVLTDNDDLSDEGIAGVVSRRKSHVIQIATDQFPQEATRYRLDLSPDETTRRRQLIAMSNARTQRGRSGRLRDVLLGIQSPRFDGKKIDQVSLSPSTINEIIDEIDFRTDLNPSQRQAVAFALLADDVAVIHGPPGTGKTTTLAETIAQAVMRGDRVLACAASNTAVDNLLERLVALLPYVVRVGHPARVFEHLRDYTLDGQVQADPASGVVKDLRRELEQVLRYATKRGRSGPGTRGNRGELFAEAGRLRGQIRSLEKTVVRGILDKADVICTTTTLDEDLLSDERFDLVVIDEACQATEPGLWQAILRADRLIIAGDHCQLPPTVLSDEAAKMGMRDSLMQRLVEHFGDGIYRRLTVQYRMHQDIMRFSSDHFYDGSLVADQTVREHQLTDLANVDADPLSESPLMMIDTAGGGHEEELEPDGQSKLNRGEAELIAEIVRRLEESGVRGDQIAIIAPYAAQVRLLRSKLDLEGLEIDTVDGFQGREKEVVLLTMVRSNAEGIIGFLADQRRSNVAITRAKRKLVMVGDSATLGIHPFYEMLLSYFESAGSYHSVFEFDAIT